MTRLLPVLVFALPACSDGPATVSPANGEVLLVTLDETWRGGFSGSALYLSSEVADEDKGPTVTSDGEAVTLTWRSLVYEDCKPPTGVAAAWDGDTLELTFQNDGQTGQCGLEDVVANATTSFELRPAGTWSVVVGSTVSAVNNGASNLPPQTLKITVP